MMRRLTAIVFIYVCTVAAWMVLGATVLTRTRTQDEKLREAVGQLWGSAQVQYSPVARLDQPPTQASDGAGGRAAPGKHAGPAAAHVPLKASKIDVSLSLDQRQKGLLWYSTYVVVFSAEYTIANETEEGRTVSFEFSLPTRDGLYDDVRVTIGSQVIDDLPISCGTYSQPIRLEAGQSETVRISYRSQGMDQWFYHFGKDVNQVRDFVLTMKTDFADIDFPESCISPTEKAEVANGWELKWQYTNLLAGAQIGMDLPRKLNPGPWVSKVTFSAPISLFFFFFILFMLTILRHIKVHPMNYFFIGAAFFSFHLLLAYLVDHISIHAAFLVSSAVSVFLVVSYMRLVVGPRFAFIEIALCQFVYLVLFSYTFFFRGYTGLTITVLCILTLFAAMQLTAKVDWDEIFKQAKSEHPAPTEG